MSRASHVATFAAGAILGAAALAAAVPKDTVRFRSFDAFAQALALVETNYVDAVDEQNLLRDAVRGMLHNLDPHSTFLPPNRYKNMRQDTEGEFGSVGVALFPGEVDEAFPRSLTIVLAITTLLALPIAEYTYRALLSSKRLRKYAEVPLRDKSRVIDDPAEKVLTLVQQATVARVSIYNAPALFGLIICLLGINSGFIFAYPQYVIAAVPAFLQLGFLAATFPTRDRLVRVVRGVLGRG